MPKTSRAQRKNNRELAEQRSEENKKSGNTKSLLNFELKKVQPLTENQQRVFETYKNNKDLLLAGTAGTGKTFLSLYLGLKTVIDDDRYKSITIFRSVVPGRQMGFLPGDEKTKAEVYESPYVDICNELFGRADAYSYQKTKKLIRFETTSFARGITIKNSVVIIDEFQNMNSSELHTLMTRIGENCRVILAGDIRQNDLKNTSRHETSGFKDFFKIISSMDNFSRIEFTRDDIIRSEFVKSYIIAREELEDQDMIDPL